MSDVPAGWHQDPSNPNQERWWDGTQWSPNQVRPKPLAGPASNQFPQQPPGAPGPYSGPTNQQFGPSSNFQTQSYGATPKQGGNGTLLLIIGGSIVLFAVVALVGVALLRSSGNDEVAASQSTSPQQPIADLPVSPTPEPPGDRPLSPPPVNQEPTDGLEDVSNCALAGEERLSVDITNSTSAVNDYFVDLAYLDDAGNRVDDGSYYVPALRPGEVAQEQQLRIDPELGVASCEILEVSRRAVEFDQALVDQVSECEMSFERYSTKSAMTITNPDEGTYDYTIVVAITGPDGVRRSTDLAYVDNVRTNEPTAADASLYGLDEEEYQGLSCEVVHVTRRDK